MTRDLFLLFVKATLFLTAAVYVSMMVLYFKNGPKRKLERLTPNTVNLRGGGFQGFGNSILPLTSLESR